MRFSRKVFTSLTGNFFQSWWATCLSGEFVKNESFHTGSDRSSPLSAAKYKSQDETGQEGLSSLSYQQIYNSYNKENGKS